MSTATQTAPLRIGINRFIFEFEWFIQEFRKMEKTSVQQTEKVLYSLFPKELASHLNNHWRGKKKEFGSFWLNLDYGCQIKFLNYWNIEDPDDERYLTEKEEKENLILQRAEESGERRVICNFDEVYTNPPYLSNLLFNVLVFFHNHGIEDNFKDLIGIEKLPVWKKRYGVARNWCDFFITLNKGQKHKLLNHIFEMQKISL